MGTFYGTVYTALQIHKHKIKKGNEKKRKTKKYFGKKEDSSVQKNDTSDRHVRTQRQDVQYVSWFGIVHCSDFLAERNYRKFVEKCKPSEKNPSICLSNQEILQSSLHT